MIRPRLQNKSIAYTPDSDAVHSKCPQLLLQPGNVRVKGVAKAVYY